MKNCRRGRCVAKLLIFGHVTYEKVTKNSGVSKVREPLAQGRIQWEGGGPILTKS